MTHRPAMPREDQTTNIGTQPVRLIEEEVAKLPMATSGAPNRVMDIPRPRTSRPPRVDRKELGGPSIGPQTPVPILYRRSRRSAAVPKTSSGDQRDTLLEQCEQGSDLFTVHAAGLRVRAG